MATNFNEELLTLIRGLTGQTIPGQPPITVVVQGAPASGNPQPVTVTNNWRSLLLTQASSSGNGSLNARFWTVPGNREWQILAARCLFTAGATVGNRRLAMDVYASAGTIGVYPVGAEQAGGTARFYNWAIGQPYLTGFVGDRLLTPMPPLVLAAGQSISFYDLNQVANFQDTFTGLNLLVAERVV